MHKELLQSNLKLDLFDDIFMIVRNPYDRFCSGYWWRNKANFNSAPSIEVWTEKIFKDYAENNYILDNHLRPKNEFKPSNTTIYKLEQDFEVILKDLESRHNIKLNNNNIK